MVHIHSTTGEKLTAAASTSFTESDIRAQLDRIRTSPEFDVPERASKFLAYIVEETVAGRADRIKGYSIATVVFGRDSSFDAQADPVVRIEAGRIRRALERYYLTAGKDDPIVMTMPKGAYVPVFTRRGHGSDPTSLKAPIEKMPAPPVGRHLQWKGILPALAGMAFVIIVVVAGSRSVVPVDTGIHAVGEVSRATPDVPMLLVAPFEDLSGTPNSAIIARGLTDEVIGQIARFKEIVVIAAREPSAGKALSAEGRKARYALEGRIQVQENRFRLSARLVSRPDGAVVWTKSYDENLEVRNLLELEAAVARDVATALAQPYGIIFQSDATRVDRSPPDDWQAYQCTLAYYAYRADLNPQTHASVQDCLKRAVDRFPGYATAWALLALTYVDEMRFRYRLDAKSPPPLDLAAESAQRAVDLDPQNVRGLQAQMLTMFFHGDVETALKIGARAVSINPDDPELIGEYGSRLAFSGQWKEGCELVAQAATRNPGPLGYFEMRLAACSYMQRDYLAAEKWIRTADLQANPIYHFLAAAILGQLGKTADAGREWRWIEINAPGLLGNVRHEVANRFPRPEDQVHFLDGLRKAGLQIPDS